LDPKTKKTLSKTEGVREKYELEKQAYKDKYGPIKKAKKKRQKELLTSHSRDIENVGGNKILLLILFKKNKLFVNC